MTSDTIELFGLPIWAGTRASLLAQLYTQFEGGAGGVFIAPLNAQLAELLHRDGAFAAALATAAFCVPDGMPIVWLARALGRPVAERIAGRELWLDICGIAAERGLAVYLVGGAVDTLDAAVDRLRARFPRLRIAGRHAPSRPFDPAGREADELIDIVRASGADIVFAGLGAPKQELWLVRAMAGGGLRCGLGVGGSFDVYAGRVSPPPAWIARAGFEWLWRWMHDPARLFLRYTAGNARFLYRAFKYFFREKSKKR